MSNFQDLPSEILQPPWPWTSNFKRPPSAPLPLIPYMWTNEIKTKAKPSHITFKLTICSILWFIPRSNAMVSLKDGFTVRRQKEDFLSIICINVWLSMMSAHGANSPFPQIIIINKTIGCPEHSLTPYSIRPITSHFCLNPPSF